MTKSFGLILLGMGLAGLIACSTASTHADDTSPDGVRVQYFNDPDRSCVVFTHDTAQGASIAVNCQGRAHL